MFSYIIILLIVLVVVHFEKVYLKRKAIIFPITVLVLFASIRSFNVGTDSIVYTEPYRLKYNPYYHGFNANVEYGYQFVDYWIMSFFSNYFWFFLFFSIFVVCLYITTMKRLSVNYLQSIFVYITFGFYTFFFNGLRQGIAMALFFFSLPYMLDRKIVIYFLIVCIASLFHISALMMIPLYFLIHLKIKIEWKVLYCFSLSLLSSQILIKYLAQSNVRYENYTQEAEKAGGYITLAFYFLLGLLIYFFGNHIRKQEKLFSSFEQIYLCGLALVFPLALLGTDPSGPQRLLYYFASLTILIIPYFFYYYRKIYVKLLFVFLSIIYFVLTTMRFGNLYPYSINPIFEIF